MNKHIVSFALFLLVSSPWKISAAQTILQLEQLPLDKTWVAKASAIEIAETPEGKVLRWKLQSGQDATLSLPVDGEIFQALWKFDRLEMDFRVASGRIEKLNLSSKGHVSGIYKYKVFDWGLALLTTPRGKWLSRQINLALPSWHPWDNPDGVASHFHFSAVAIEPGTVLEFRDMRLLQAGLVIKPFFSLPITWPSKQTAADGSVTYTLDIQVLNASGKPTTVKPEVVSKNEAFKVTVEPAILPAKNGETVTFIATAKIAKAAIDSLPELASEPLKVRFSDAQDAEAFQTFETILVRPLSVAIQDQFTFDPAVLASLRKRVQEGDKTLRTSLQYDNLIQEVDEFCKIQLDQMPGGHHGVGNAWPTVPGTNPPARYLIGSKMPEVINPVTKAREIGTSLSNLTWKEYLAYSGRITEKLGLAYVLTGDEKYAAKAVELMEVYAQQYPEATWASRFDPPWSTGLGSLSSGRIANNVSYGSNRYFIWHTKMLALIAGSPALTPEAKQRIYEGFVRPYATELIKFPGGISNMTDMTNQNLFILGLIFDDAQLVRWALQSDPGLLMRLTDIDEDGFSSEGRPMNYHYAAMDEYLPSIAYLKNSGLKGGIPEKNLIEAILMPYRRATLWGVVPTAGDNGRGGNRVGPTKVADLMAELFPDQTWLLELGTGSTPASQVMAMDSGKSPDPDAYKKYLESTPRIFRHAGFAILRMGTTPQTQIMVTLDYGSSPMHGHRDRGQITLAAFGKMFSQGTGTLYNAGSGGMTRTQDPRLDAFCGGDSLGQNIILVNKENQQAAIGELVSWSDEPERQSVVARIVGAYPGVTHTRGVLLQDSLVIVTDRIEAESDRMFDWVYHNYGTFRPGAGWQVSAPKEPLGTEANYQNIVDLQALTGTGPLHVIWDLTEQTLEKEPAASRVGLSFWQIAPEGTEFYTGKTGMNNSNTNIIPDAVPSIFSRVSGRSAEFVTVLEPFDDASKVTGVQKTGNQLQIQRGGQTSTIALPDMAK